MPSNLPDDENRRSTEMKKLDAFPDEPVADLFGEAAPKTFEPRCCQECNGDGVVMIGGEEEPCRVCHPEKPATRSFAAQVDRAVALVQELQANAEAEVKAAGGVEVARIHDEVVYDVPKSAVAKLTSRLSKAGKIEPTAKLKPTEEQERIIRTALDNRVSVVQAGAGTGKTTTLAMLAEAMPGRGQYTAFNTSLVNDSKSKFPESCPANTIHSLAFRAEGRRFAHRLGGARVRSSDVARQLGIADFEVPALEGTKNKKLNAGLLAGHVLGAIRRFCQSADSSVETKHFGMLQGIDHPKVWDNNNLVREYLLPFAIQAWADLSSPDGRLPFQHDHYVKVWQLNHPVISADYILLDEAQDTSPVMLDILGKQKAKIVLVGDSAQQIYEWRGAVDALKAFPDAPRSLLSQSYRFGDAIASVANQVLGLLSEPTALRLKGLPTIASRVEAVKDPTAILCRTNAFAVAALLNAISAGKRPFMIGGGSEVVSFVEAAKSLQQGKSTAHPELACFDHWNEVKEYAKSDEGEDLRLMVKLIDTFGCDPIIQALRRMPTEKEADLVVITTAHKSKGRQWKSVRLAGDFPTKSKCGDSDLKLLYVAVTRAQLTLDVTGCPFFTGDDSLDISRTPQPAGQEQQPEATTPTPASPVENTWTRWKDGRWLVKGAKGQAGTVKVVRKNGSSSHEMLGKAVWQDEVAAIYEIR
jgi:hypothetical protein